MNPLFKLLGLNDLHGLTWYFVPRLIHITCDPTSSTLLLHYSCSSLRYSNSTYIDSILSHCFSTSCTPRVSFYLTNLLCLKWQNLNCLMSNSHLACSVIDICTLDFSCVHDITWLTCLICLVYSRCLKILFTSYCDYLLALVYLVRQYSRSRILPLLCLPNDFL